MVLLPYKYITIRLAKEEKIFFSFASRLYPIDYYFFTAIIITYYYYYYFRE